MTHVNFYVLFALIALLVSSGIGVYLGKPKEPTFDCKPLHIWVYDNHSEIICAQPNTEKQPIMEKKNGYKTEK